MAKQRLFPEPEGEKREPTKRFDETASKVFSISKTELDQRERDWQRERKKARGKH